MFDTNNIISKQYNLIDAQVDILLKSLEFYAYTLHNTWDIEVDKDLQDLRNSLIFHTYESLIDQKKDYTCSYDIKREYRIIKHKRDYQNFYQKKCA